MTGAAPHQKGALVQVKSLHLPPAYVQLSRALERGGTSWFVLKQKVDAYGNYFGGRLALWTAAEAARSGTDWLTELYGLDDWSPDEIAELDKDLADSPGALPYFRDFSQIVCFGQDSGNDEPFCFDFRENLQEPSSICFDTGYANWRQVAPNFEQFIDLYMPSRHVTSDAEAQEMYGGSPEWPRMQELGERRGFSREALALTEEALATIHTGREAKTRL